MYRMVLPEWCLNASERVEWCSSEVGRGNLNSAPVLWTGHQNVTVDAKFDRGYDIAVKSLILRTRCVGELLQFILKQNGLLL